MFFDWVSVKFTGVENSDNLVMGDELIAYILIVLRRIWIISPKYIL